MNPVHYRTVRVDGVEIFYREAGPAGAPTILLLHGFPTSSHMFRDLLGSVNFDQHPTSRHFRSIFQRAS
jgi:pimeloyl-ACP methyl ester carboxylesterase